MIKTEQDYISKYMSDIKEALKIGANYLLKNIENCSIEIQKGHRDFALATDLALEKIYQEYLFGLYPDVPILGEELTPKVIDENYDGRFWAIDPIDGTVNYSRKIPAYGTSIALIEKGKPIAVGVCFPSLNETYIAGLGKGAFLNGKNIYVSKNTDLNSSILAYGDFSVKSNNKMVNRVRLKYIEKFAYEVLRVRMPGSAALQLAWVATGKVDISITLSNNAWDVQGGVLLVREAGGNVYDFDGSEHSIKSRYTLASNSNVKRYVVNLMLAHD
jgi:myo-inositol-1(or 4)-monophosphatase